VNDPFVKSVRDDLQPLTVRGSQTRIGADGKTYKSGVKHPMSEPLTYAQVQERRKQRAAIQAIEESAMRELLDTLISGDAGSEQIVARVYGAALAFRCESLLFISQAAIARRLGISRQRLSVVVDNMTAKHRVNKGFQNPPVDKSHI
jgi:hypothetical protein